MGMDVKTTIQGMVEKLISDYAPQKIILFGSYAKGIAGPDSDIDLFIIKGTSARPIDRWVEVRQILSDPGRKFPIETLVLTPQEVSKRVTAGDQFITKILEEGRVLYAA